MQGKHEALLACLPYLRELNGEAVDRAEHMAAVAKCATAAQKREHSLRAFSDVLVYQAEATARVRTRPCACVSVCVCVFCRPPCP